MLMEDFHNSTMLSSRKAEMPINIKSNCCGGENAENVNEDIVSWAVCVVFPNC